MSKRDLQPGARDGADARASPSARSIPKRIAHYLVFSLIGSGGMARVYRALDEKLDRLVALKVLSTSDVDAASHAQQRRRILREARSAAALQHPNVVAIYEVGDEHEPPFIAMEMVEGLGLRDASDKAPLTTRLRWLCEAARALEATHAAGLVHRDVKPGNMVVDSNGVLRLLDFGIAKGGDENVFEQELEAAEVGPSSLRTSAGRRIGTPKYMAPEQLAGLPSDARTDQFAWGLVAFEILTRTSVPVRSEDGAVSPEALDELNDIDAAAAHVIRRALARDQPARFASMTDLVAALSHRSELDTREFPLANAGGGSNQVERARSPLAPPRRRLLVGGLALAATVVALASASIVLLPMLRRSHLESGCTVAPTRSWPGFAPSHLLALPGGKTIAGVYDLDADAKDARPGIEGLILESSKRIDLLEPFGIEVLARGGSVRVVAAESPQRPMIVTSRYAASWPPKWARPRTTLLAVEAGTSRFASAMTHFIPSSIAAVDDGQTVLVATTGQAETVDENDHVVPTPGAPHALVLQSFKIAAKRVTAYESQTALSGVALSRREGSFAVGFVEGAAISVLHFGPTLTRTNPKVSITSTASPGPPAMAFVGETLYVAFAQREGRATRLAVHAEVGRSSFAPVAGIEETGVVLDSPRIAALPSGGALLVWLVSSSNGDRVRAVRLGRQPSRPFDLGAAPAREATLAWSDQGALVAWLDARDGNARSTAVTCVSTPAFAASASR